MRSACPYILIILTAPTAPLYKLALPDKGMQGKQAGAGHTTPAKDSCKPECVGCTYHLL